MANSYVAVANDASAMFWNPAGMAFTPVREVQFSLAHQTTMTKTTASGSRSVTTADDHQRFRLGNAALLRALPATQGGAAYALGFQSPYMIDEIRHYEARYNDNGDQITLRNDYSAYGHLNFWTGAFGIQIAPDVGMGFALSLVQGRDKMFKRFERLTNGEIRDSINDSYDDEIVHTYMPGVDLRAGILFKPLERLSVGVRIVMPAIVRFKEEFSEKLTALPGSDFETITERGALRIPASGSIGVSYEFAYLLLSIEARGRAPMIEAHDKSNLSEWNTGGSIGAEAPLFERLVLRAGYAYEHYEKYPFVLVYDDSDLNRGPQIDPARPLRHEQRLTVGGAWLTEQGTAFTLSYGYTFYETEINSPVVLHEKHNQHRVMASVAIRY
jgi:hypothetical protein